MRQQKQSVSSDTQRAGAATMSRIVQCPKCRVLLQEPPPGNPYYQCGSCSTTLQAKHANLESTNIRLSQHVPNPKQVEKLSSSKGSRSDSSSEEISERVGDDSAYGGDGSPSWSPHRKEAPMYGRARTAAAADELFRPSSGNFKAGEMQHPDRGPTNNNHHPHQTQHPSQQMTNFDQEVVDRLPHGPEYGHRRTASAAAVGERNNSSTSSGTHEAYGFHQPMTRSTSSAGRVSIGRGDVESEALRTHQLPFAPQQQELQRTHSDPVTPSEQQQLNSSGPLKATTGEAVGTLTTSSTSGRTSKLLKWQARPEAVEKQAAALLPTALDVVMSGRGIVDDDRIAVADGSSHEDRVKETASVMERNWRELPSRRRGKHEDKIGQSDASSSSQQNIQHTVSDGSEKNFDMYENSPSAAAAAVAFGAGPDEARETSSIMDEGDGNEGGNGGRFSPPPALQLPDLRGGIPRSSQSRPNVPRSNVPSGGRPMGYNSEDPNPQSSKLPSEVDSLDSPHHHLDKMNRSNRRQHSWDATRTANSPVPGTESGLLRKSSSDDYGNMISEQQHEHTRNSSDPTVGTVYHPQQQLPPQVDQQHQWIARLKPQQPPPPRSNSTVASSGVNSPRPPTHSQSDRSSGSNSQAPFVEPNPLPLSQLGGSHPASQPSSSASAPPPSRPMPDSSAPGGQLLPPKQVNYPPLPPPGALPHVLCQHCHTLLAVPVNLPPPRKSTQKLRCGACMKISTFSVPQPSVEPSFSASRSEVQPLFASSPDAHESSSSPSNPEFRAGRSLSATSDDLRRHGRRFSDLSDKSLPITRNNSLGSADMPTDEELAERTRVVMKMDGHSHSNPAISTTSGSSEPHHGADVGVRSYSDGHSPSTSEYRSRFSRGVSPQGSLYPKRGGFSLEHGPGSGSGSGSSGRYQTEERSRFAADPRPSSRRHEEGVASSDSDSEHHQSLSHGSPQMDGQGQQHGYTPSSSRSPSHHYAHSPPLPASGHGEHSGKEHQEHQHRSLNKALKGFINIKSSLRELTHRAHKDHPNHVRSKVSVNGVPIPDNLVKKAEEHAGTILPGSYWYDEHAGFWGVQGGQCEGIIPPCIEEFHYPMSRDCAGGRTGVLVNGRELHVKDLEILAKRGLPSTPGRAYRIDIDGRVVNEATGEEHRGLGRLAPSLQHTRRGSGMYTHTR